MPPFKPALLGLPSHCGSCPKGYPLVQLGGQRLRIGSPAQAAGTPNCRCTRAHGQQPRDGTHAVMGQGRDGIMSSAAFGSQHNSSPLVSFTLRANPHACTHTSRYPKVAPCPWEPSFVRRSLQASKNYYKLAPKANTTCQGMIGLHRRTPRRRAMSCLPPVNLHLAPAT